MKFITALLVFSYGLLVLQIALVVAGGSFIFVLVSLPCSAFVTYCWFSIRNTNRRIKIIRAETARIEAETETIRAETARILRGRPRA